MTSISTALSLVDAVGQAAARPAPSVAVSGDAGFDAVFARILDQRDQPSPSHVADEQSERTTDRLGAGERGNDAVTRRDRVRTKGRTDEMDRSASSEPSADRTDAAADDENVERPASTEVVLVAATIVPSPVAGIPGAVPAMSPSVAPGPGADAASVATAGEATAVVAAATATAVTTMPGTPVPAAPDQATGAAVPKAGEVAGEQSIPVPTETVAEVIASVQAEGMVPSAGPATEASPGEPTTGEAPAGAPTVGTQTAVASGSTANGSEPGAAGDGTSASGNGNQTAGGDAGALGQAAQMTAEVPVEPITGQMPGVAGTGAADDASAPGPSSDARGSSSTVGSVTSSAPTTTERVEASTVRGASPDAQRPVDGRLRDRFVGSGLGATMTVDLSDEGLGQLSLQAHQGGGALHVTLAAGESSTRELLLGQSASLRSELEASGTRLGSFDVTDQLPRETGRDGAGDGASGRGAADRPDRGVLGDRSSTAAAPRPPSARSAATTGIDLLI